MACPKVIRDFIEAPLGIKLLVIGATIYVLVIFPLAITGYFGIDIQCGS